MSPEAEEKIMKHLSDLTNDAVPADSSSASLDDYDFVVRKQFVRLDATCICGSHKAFRDCCGRAIAANP